MLTAVNVGGRFAALSHIALSPAANSAIKTAIDNFATWLMQPSPRGI